MKEKKLSQPAISKFQKKQDLKEIVARLAAVDRDGNKMFIMAICLLTEIGFFSGTEKYRKYRCLDI